MNWLNFLWQEAIKVPHTVLCKQCCVLKPLQKLLWKFQKLSSKNTESWLQIMDSKTGFESRCSHLNFRYLACFEQGFPWYSDNCIVWIHCVLDMIKTYSQIEQYLPILNNEETFAIQRVFKKVCFKSCKKDFIILQKFNCNVTLSNCFWKI